MGSSGPGAERAADAGSSPARTADPGPLAAGPNIYPAFPQVFAALSEAGLEWCLLRDLEGLADPTGDVDLLVSARDAALLDPLLTRFGYARIRSWGRGSHRCFVAYDEGGDRWLKLDVVTELSYGPGQALRTDAAGEVLAGSRNDGLVLRPSPGDAFWILLLHCLLDRGDAPGRHGESLRRLARLARPEGELAAVLDANCPPGWSATRVLEAAAAGDWEGLGSLGAELRRRWIGRRPHVLWPRILLAASLRRLSKLQTAFGRRGIAVAVLGPDGAGKSTLAAGLARSFFFPARVLYLGLYGASVRQPWSWLPGLGLARRFLRLRGAALVATYDKARGRLVVFDRHGYDILARTPEELSGARRLRRWLLARSAPSPDLVILLDVSPEAAFGRKGEHSLEALAVQRRDYRTLAAVLPRCSVIDAGQDADAVRRAATAAVWRRYVDR